MPCKEEEILIRTSYVGSDPEVHLVSKMNGLFQFFKSRLNQKYHLELVDLKKGKLHISNTLLVSNDFISSEVHVFCSLNSPENLEVVIRNSRSARRIFIRILKRKAFDRQCLNAEIFSLVKTYFQCKPNDSISVTDINSMVLERERMKKTQAYLIQEALVNSIQSQSTFEEKMKVVRKLLSKKLYLPAIDLLNQMRGDYPEQRPECNIRLADAYFNIEEYLDSFSTYKLALKEGVNLALMPDFKESATQYFNKTNDDSLLLEYEDLVNEALAYQ